MSITNLSIYTRDNGNDLIIVTRPRIIIIIKKKKNDCRLRIEIRRHTFVTTIR